MINRLIMKQLLAILLLSASCVFGAVPSTTDFNTNYFTYGLLPMSLVGNLTNWSKLATNVISTNPGAGMSGTVSNNIASAGLLSVDATKTNGIAATAAHIVSTLGFTPANSNNVASDSNWVASGTTNSTLSGVATAIGGLLTGTTNTSSVFGTSVAGGGIRSEVTLSTNTLVSVSHTATLTGDNTLIYPFVFEVNGDTFTGGDCNGLFAVSTLYGSTNWTSPLFFGNAIYGSVGSVSAPNYSDGASVGVLGVNSGWHYHGFGVIGSVQNQDTAGSESVGVVGTSLQYADSDIVVGGYFETPESPGGFTYPSFERAVVLADSRGSGAPLFVGRTNNGTTTFSVVATGLTTANSGFSSLATDSFLTFTSTGITNTLGKLANARFDGTAITYVIKNNAGTPVYTNAVSVGHAFEQLQSGGAIVITAGTGVTGTVAPQ